jgi:hypothetical protein
MNENWNFPAKNRRSKDKQERSAILKNVNRRDIISEQPQTIIKLIISKMLI